MKKYRLDDPFFQLIYFVFQTKEPRILLVKMQRMKMENRFLLILVLGIGTKGFTQTSGPNLGWQYSLYPSGKEYTTVSKTALFADVSNHFQNFSLEHDFQFEMDQVDLPVEYWTEGSRDVHIYDFSYAVNFSYFLSENVGFHVDFAPSVISTFESTLSSDDIVLYGGAFASFNSEIGAKPTYLKLGIAYSSYFGEPEILPVFAFSTVVSEKFTVQVGFPESEIAYKFKPSSLLRGSLNYEGKYVNLGPSLSQKGNDPAEKLKWEWTSLELNYSHELSTLWTIELGTGYLLKNTFSLRNENEQTLSTIKLDPSLFLTSGIKLKIN